MFTGGVHGSLHLRLASVPSLCLGDISFFLIASEGMRRKGRVLELVPLAVWEENYSEETQLAPTKVISRVVKLTGLRATISRGPPSTFPSIPLPAAL